MIRTTWHYGIHFILPLLVALFIYPKQWKKVYIIMLACMLIDLDHLLASPIFDSNRCSINFHPLHTYYAIVAYFILIIPRRTRIIGLGLIIHILADYVDCWLM